MPRGSCLAAATTSKAKTQKIEKREIQNVKLPSISNFLWKRDIKRAL